MLRASGLLGDTLLWDPMYRVLDPRRVRKALDPNARRDFEVIVEREARKLAGKGQKVLEDFYDRVFARLDESWVGLPTDHREAVLRRTLDDVRRGFPDDELGSEVAAIAAVSSASIIKRAGKGFQTLHKLPQKTFEWTGKEDDFAAWLGESSGNYVTTINGKIHDAASGMARDIVRRGFDVGLGREDIADELKDALASKIGRTNLNYFRGVASTYVSRAREYAHAISMSRANIERFRWESVLDSATCPRCRFMHGRIFGVGNALGIFEKLQRLKNPEDIKYAQPWPIITPLGEGLSELGVPTKKGIVPIAREIRSGLGIVGDAGEWEALPASANLETLNVVSPPLHAKCRCTQVPIL